MSRPKIELFADPQGYSLAVNGSTVIVGESFAVCDGVRNSLNGHATTGELREVADAIRKACRLGDRATEPRPCEVCGRPWTPPPSIGQQGCSRCWV